MKIRPSSILSVTILYLVLFGFFILLNSCGQPDDSVLCSEEYVQSLIVVRPSVKEFCDIEGVYCRNIQENRFEAYIDIKHKCMREVRTYVIL